MSFSRTSTQPRLLARQFWALFVKNWIILSRHWFLNLMRCLILPIGYGIFVSVAQLFLLKPNVLGIGNPVNIYPLAEAFPSDGSLALIYAAAPNITSTLPSQVISLITAQFSQKQLQAVHEVASPDDVAGRCQQNFNGFSECFAAVVFNDVDDPSVLNYTIRADAGLFFVDVRHHKSDFEKRVLPLQWAVDQAIIAITTNESVPTPQEWPFTNETDAEQSLKTRLNFIKGIRSLLVLGLLIAFLGIPYHLPGSYTAERASGVSALMAAMGCGNGIRLLSFHAAISLAYLPAWIIVAAFFKFRIFTSSSLGLIIGIHLLLGLSLASYSLFLTLPFARSPALSAVVSTFATIVLAIAALVFSSHPSCTTTAACIFTLIFPPGFYIFVMRAVAGWEIDLNGVKIGMKEVTTSDPQSGLTIGALIAVAVVVIFAYPMLTVLIERWLYEPRRLPGSSGTDDNANEKNSDQDVAINVKGLSVVYSSRSIWKRSTGVRAIDNLSLDIPRGGIFVLLGSNGHVIAPQSEGHALTQSAPSAGKSTLLSVLAGHTKPTEGTVYINNRSSAPIGVVPQKNVLIDELTCAQLLNLFCSLKSDIGRNRADRLQDVNQLLEDVGLTSKKTALAGSLSGGMKRKLQLGVGLSGNSEFLLVDECTSGVDPLSRRSLWRTLSAMRDDRTVIFTTHFLDEADLLGDRVAILSAPGKLCAEGPPVALKNSLGDGYILHVAFEHSPDEWQHHNRIFSERSESLLSIATEYAREAKLDPASTASNISVHLKSNDSGIADDVLRRVEQEKASLGLVSYDLHSSSLEDVFSQLMTTNVSTDSLAGKEPAAEMHEKEESDSVKSSASAPLVLSDGRAQNPFAQALTIYHKRLLILRRSWLTPLLMVLVAVCGSCIPLFFMVGRVQTCEVNFEISINIPLFLPLSPIYGGFLSSLAPNSRVLEAPPDIIATLGTVTNGLHVTDVADSQTFISDINANVRNLTLGGISIEPGNASSLFAWEASTSFTGPTLANLVSNILWNTALNKTIPAPSLPRIISANYQAFPAVDTSSLVALKWIAFFGATMAAFPAFFALYIAKERRSEIQAMQFSNGLSHPAGLWLGHLLFDSMFCILIATIITIFFAATSPQFHGLGYFWLIMSLYGLVGALFAYSAAYITKSPLASFAIVAGYQVLMFIAYIAGYLLTLTYAKTSQAGNVITIISSANAIIVLIAILISVRLYSIITLPSGKCVRPNYVAQLRAGLISVNLFTLLCSGNTVSTSAMGSIGKFGGPTVYLLAYGIALLTALIIADLGSWKVFRRRRRRPQEQALAEDKSDTAAQSLHDLQSNNVSKRYRGSSAKAVDDISFSVERNSVYALLGPNGAGKTTLFNIIRGEIIPDRGDVLIKGVSVVNHPATARLSLGVCPQFTAIDAQLTVKEHLYVYGRLKGVKRGPDLEDDINSLLTAVTLAPYTHRLASQLSGGNQRKLALAISLIGNPSVVLIDEFSTGIDPKTKRDMWATFSKVAVDKAMIMTTHSMEEAAVLSNRVGIMAGKMLMSGTTEELVQQHGTYEVHFAAKTPEDVIQAKELMSKIPNARMMQDVATRFEVPLTSHQALSSLFRTLRCHGANGEYAIERGSLESIFIKVVREHQISEDGGQRGNKRWWSKV